MTIVTKDSAFFARLQIFQFFFTKMTQISVISDISFFGGKYDNEPKVTIYGTPLDNISKICR